MIDYTSIKDIAKEVREQLKKEFPQYKFSVTKESYSGGQSLRVHLMSAPEAVTVEPMQYGHEQLNHYTIREDFEEGKLCNGVALTETAWNVLKRADEIANARNWNNSDSQSDYFDVNFWFHLSIGKWNKPFEVK